MTTANWIALYWGIGIVHTMIGMWVHRDRIHAQMQEMGTWADPPEKTAKTRAGLLFVRYRWVLMGAIGALSSLFWPVWLAAEIATWRPKK